MKILFYRYGSICEPDIISAFAQLGHTVLESTEQITNKALSAQDAIAHLSSYLLDHPVDCVFSINFFPTVSEVCNIFHLRYLSWIVDSPVMELYATSITNPWNRVFLFDKAQYREFHELNPNCIFHLPLAANILSKKELFSTSTRAQMKRYQHDVAFVGSLYTEKCPYDKLSDAPAYLTGYLNGLMAAQEKVYGYYFVEEVLTNDIIAEFKAHLPGFYSYPAASYLTDRQTVAQLYIGNKISALERMDTMRMLSEQFQVDIYTGSDTSAFPRLVNHGLAKTLTEMPLIFHGTRINLNITSKAIRAGLPLRIWDIMSCGGFVLTNYQEEIHDYFTPGQDLAVYGSLQELRELTAYYLTHEKERQEIAHNGYELLSSNHTYPIRLTQLLSTAFEH